MIRNLSSVNFNLPFLLIYEIIILVMIFARCSKMQTFFDKDLLQLVSEAVVNNSKRNEKLAQHKMDLKINKIEIDEN